MEQIVSRQEQILELNESLGRSPMVSAVTRTGRDDRRSQTARLPKLPSLPFMSEMPTAQEIIEVQYGFAAKLMDANKRFALELASAFETVADERTVDPGKEDATADARKAATETAQGAASAELMRAAHRLRSRGPCPPRARVDRVHSRSPGSALCPPATLAVRRMRQGWLRRAFDLRRAALAGPPSGDRVGWPGSCGRPG